MIYRRYNTSLLDLSTKDAQVIAQQCNCVSRHGKGLADDIARKFPHADPYASRTSPSKPGTIKIFGKGKERKVIAMFAQYNPGKPKREDTSKDRTEWFEECLNCIGRIKNLRSIAFPMKIGCGLAGGDWECYEKMIENFAEDYPEVKVIICSLDDEPKKVSKSDTSNEDIESQKQSSSDFDENDHSVDHYRDLLERAFSTLDDLHYSINWCDECMYWTASDDWDGRVMHARCEDESDRTLCRLCFKKIGDRERFDAEDEKVNSKDSVGRLTIDDGLADVEKVDSKDSDEEDVEPIKFTDGLDTVISVYEDVFRETGWWEFFETVVKNKTIAEIDKVLMKDAKNVNIYPPPEEVFNAMILTTLSQLKVVIIGQDPYHTPGAAMGLAFGHHSDRGTLQPSVRNIYTELISDGFKVNMKSGDLSKWAEEGVFLINTALTVKQGQANSYSEDWKYFTSQLMRFISCKCDHLVVIMWGGHAQSYSNLFDATKHKLLKSSHPGPFSAHINFFGSKPFSKANTQLKKWGMKPIDWNLA